MERKKCKKELGYQIWAAASVWFANLVQINFHDIDDVITLTSRGFKKRFNSFSIRDMVTEIGQYDDEGKQLN